VVLVHAVRYREELTYRDQIGRIEAAHSNQLRMVSFVSREDTEFAIKGRVPQAILDGRLQTRAQIDISATQSQVMICGNPDMVRDTTAILESRGLKKNRRKDPGQVTVEAYW
ncbi:MAG: ferredoxin--NADP(+) reductase, partial [Pyrinomonadaceae bacterium]